MNSPIGFRKEYRCTRNKPYRSQNCPGHADWSARQGYYVYATSREDALHQMADMFPDERRDHGFTVQLWKE